jgi:hypothetical protein
MSTKLLSLLAGVALAVTFSAAQAGEPERLTTTQLDGVTAGAAVAASLGAGICQGGSTACGTSASQRARAHSSLRVGSNGSIRARDSASARSSGSANSTGGGAASVAVGVAAAGF